ncbi:hypothetical protein AG1IA_10089 [Rhizoctonia solani AG-1 IA]|uniref:Uncharacterized protein n=1 Tax=Thanatephorus cucumeris (strain AG1-IA) TaxID=983506 RepID=L8WCI9_THACA|nr:hypothetical protein AG1IA_10089 [Rhizoctonia solani AG-1 IA]
MISKPVPIAADFPPTTANLPSTTIVPALPNFTINAETGVTAQSGGGGGGGNAIARNSSTGPEHKYHYRVRPREKTASPLAAYLSAQALAQSTSQVDERERLYHHHHQSPHLLHHQAPPSSSGHQQPASSTSHLMSLPSTTPTSPASDTTASPSRIIRNRCTSLLIRTFGAENRVQVEVWAQAQVQTQPAGSGSGSKVRAALP